MYNVYNILYYKYIILFCIIPTCHLLILSVKCELHRPEDPFIWLAAQECKKLPYLKWNPYYLIPIYKYIARNMEALPFTMCIYIYVGTKLPNSNRNMLNSPAAGSPTSVLE